MAINWTALETPVEVTNKIVVAVAVAAGGAWAWYTFNGELKRDNAQAQLEKLNRELDNARQFAIEVGLTAKPLPSLGSEFSVAVQVTITNKGALAAAVPLVDKSLRVTPITIPDLPKQPELAVRSAVSPKPLMTDSEGYLTEPRELRLPAGTSNRLLYLAQVDGPGRYLVEFSTPSSGFNPKASIGDELSETAIVDVPTREVGAPHSALPNHDLSRIGN